MRWILMAMVLGGCIEEAERKPASPINPSVCGKCVRVYHEVWREVGGFPVRCVRYDATGEECCGEGCPPDYDSWGWAECDDPSPEGTWCLDAGNDDAVCEPYGSSCEG